MAVDGGAGNAISMSEIQSFYGGSNPISLSEYYRAASGTEVPTTRTDTTTNTGVTALVAQGSGGSTSGSALTGNQSSLTIDGPNNGNFNTSPGTGTVILSASATISVTRDDALQSSFRFLNEKTHFRLGGYDFIDGENKRSGSTTSGSSYATLLTLTAAEVDGTCGIEVLVGASDSDREGDLSNAVRIRRGGTVLHNFSVTLINGGGSANSSNLTGLQAGDIIEGKNGSFGGTTTATFYPREAIGPNADHTLSAGSHALSFHAVGGNNDNPGLDATLNFTTSGTIRYTSFGGTFTSVSTTDTNTTVNTNTNVPTSGTINMDVFNAPGTASA